MFYYSGSAGSLSICACEKCGTTSLFSSLYLALTNTTFRYSSHPRRIVQDFAKWGVPSVKNSTSPGDVHIIVYRDPVERYISAYYSKIRCDADGKRGFQDKEDTVPSSITRLLGEKGRVCMYFDEYVSALERVSARGLQARLNGHVQPQNVACPFYERPFIRVTDIEHAESLLRTLRWREFWSMKVAHMHDTPRTREPLNHSSAAMAGLRRLAKPEYRRIDWLSSHGYVWRNNRTDTAR